MTSPTKYCPAEDPQVSFNLRIETAEPGSESRHQAQLEAVATLLALSEETDQ